MNWSWIYIGVLYAAAVWLARRNGVALRRRVALFFYSLALLFFFQPLTQHYVMSEDDFLNTLPPWHFTAKVKTSINGELNDVPLQHTPWGVQVRESWKSGRLPLWNHYNGSGYPLLANGQSQALSIVRFLALPVPNTYFMATEAAMKILIALTFAFLFIRGRGCSELASVVGATIFGFGGFLHSWLHFPHVTTAVFLPAVLYLIDRMVEKKTLARFAGAAFVWTAILFGGHPETASHIFFLSLLYLVWIVFVEKRTNARVFLTLGGAMTVAAMLSAPFLLPFLEALPKSQRYRELEVMPLGRESLPYTDHQSLTVLFQAHFFGRAPLEEPWGPAVTEPVGGFAGVLGIAAWVALLVSVIRRRAWRSTELFFVIASVIVFGVIAGWPLIGDAIHAVLPVVAHARFRMLWIFLMGVQAAAAIDLTQRGERAPLLAGVGVVAAMLIVLFAVTDFPDAAKQATAVATSMRSVAVLALAALLALLRGAAPASGAEASGNLLNGPSAAGAAAAPRVVVLLLLVGVIGELWSVTRGWNPPLPAEMMYRRTPFIDVYESLKERNPPSSFRVIGVGAMNYPNTNVIYGIEDARAHDPMSYDRYMGFLGLLAGLKTGPENYHPWYEESDASVLDFLNVKYLVQDPFFRAPDPERWKLIHEGIDGKLYENTRVLPRFFAVRNVVIEFRDDHFFRRLKEHGDWANTALLEKLDLEHPQMHDDFFKPRPADSPLAVARVVEASPTAYRVTASAPRWSLVVSSIPWWPGWKVVRNGKEATPIRVNGAFLGFAVPPGESDVRVYYSPWTWWVGVALAAIALIGLAVTMWRRASARPEGDLATG